MKAIATEKSYKFVVRTVSLYKYLTQDKKEFALSRQMLRIKTAIGVLIQETEHAQSKADPINKMNIALKEIQETT